MARKLRVDELAYEAGVSAELIERLTDIGILKPQPDGWYGAGDLFRLEAASSTYPVTRVSWGRKVTPQPPGPPNVSGRRPSVQRAHMEERW